MEAFVGLQIYSCAHSNLRVDHIRNIVFNVFVAAVDQALLKVNEVEEEDVEAGRQDGRHVCQPVPHDDVHVVVLDE